MKKLIALLLAVLCVLPFAACGNPPAATAPQTSAQTTEKTVPATATAPSETAQPVETAPAKVVSKPMTERPVYTLKPGATAQEMRDTAVRAMTDELSILWYPDKKLVYQKTGAAEGKDFVYVPSQVYGGMAYTNGTNGLFQWLEYYDPATGCMTTTDGTFFNSTLGNSCAACVMWGWSSCVTSITWKYTYDMVQKNGCLRVGPYTYPDDLSSLQNMKTSDICNQNGRDVMYASYAQVKKADAFVEYVSAGHAIMAMQDAHVERTASGAIDGDLSYVIIQEQRAGFFQTSNDFVKVEDGENHHYNGRIGVKFSFKYLFEHFYIPCTCKEFLGQAPYATPGVTLNGTVQSMEDLSKASVQSAFKICVIYTEIRDETGEIVYERSSVVPASEIKVDVPGRQSVSLERTGVTRATLARKLTAGKNYTAKITVLDATGLLHDVVEFSFSI